MSRPNVIRDNARRLYKVMPGTPAVRWDDDYGELWDEAECTDEYRFCEMIARMINAVDCRVHVDPD